MHKEVSPGNFIAWEERAGAFESMGLAEPSGIDLTSPDAPPDSLPSWAVTEGFFDALGVRPILGAGFGQEHFQPGGPGAVMISHALWQRRFGGDPSLIGNTVEVNGNATVVAGVLPPWLEYPSPRDFWTPKQYRPGEPGDRYSSYMYAVGRLAPGVTAAEAQAELDAVAASLTADYPRTNGDAGIRLVPLKEEIVGGVRPAMLVLLGAVALLLLIACANVAHLVLARAAKRGHELSVRASLGASRMRLARQLITECLVLALVGGIAGIGLAVACLEAIVALSPPELPRIDAVALDGRVLALSAFVTLMTVSLFGLVPVLRLSRPDALAALRGGKRAHTVDRAGIRFRGGLIVIETAVAMVLLVGAGLLARSFTELVSEDLGFAVERRATIQAFLWDRNPTAEQRIRRVDEFDAQFESLPEVESAAVVSALPFHPTRIEMRAQLEVMGRPTSDDTVPEVVFLAASPDYFSTMGIPLVRGSVYDRAPADDGPARAVVNETLVRRFFKGENPLGRKVRILVRGGDPVELDVVGVVGDVRPTTFASETDPELYIPYERSGTGGVTFVVRSKGEASPMMPALRREFWQVDPNQAIYHEATVEQLVSDTLVARRFQLLLNGAFSVVALVLVAVGVFGVISFASSQRVSEIGIRMALGARAGDVLGMVLREGGVLALAGIALGLAAAFVLTRFLSSLLYGVSATDPLTFACVACLLVVVALLASLIPARRAVHVDPIVALREE
jgi:putative ABC transport system permease protein